MPQIDLDLNRLNQELRDSSPADIINWAVGLERKVVATTNFGPHEAVILHHVHKQAPTLPVICVDHGYNTKNTYRLAHKLTQQLELDMRYYTPRVTQARREAALGGVPSIYDEEAHAAFTEEVKLEPFARAFAEHQPEVWLTAIRQDQTEHRSGLDILTLDTNFDCLKVAPFFYWTERDMEDYLAKNNLPLNEDYYDPTKVESGRECGLHLDR